MTFFFDKYFNLNNYFKIISYLFIFLPIALLIGPFIPDLIVSIFALNLIFFIRKKEILEIFKLFYIRLIIIFCIINVIFSLLSEYPLLSLESSLFYFRFLFFAIFSYYLISLNSKLIYHFFIVFFIAILIVILAGFIEIFLTSFGIYFDKNIEQISGIFGDEQIMGSFISRNLPLFFYFIFIFKKNNIYFIFALSILILSEVMVYLTGERTAFFLLILQTLMIILIIKNYRLIRLSTFLISVFIIIFISILIPDTKNRMIDKTIRQIGIENFTHDVLKNKTNSMYAFSIEHQYHYTSAIKMFLSKPIIGHGPKSFREKCKLEKYFPKGCSTHPHNNYMQLLAETGIVGTTFVLFIFLLICFSLFKNFIVNNFTKNIGSDDKKSLLLISFFLTLWPIIPSGNFYNNWLNIIYYLPLIFYLFEIKKKTDYE